VRTARRLFRTLQTVAAGVLGDDHRFTAEVIAASDSRGNYSCYVRSVND
jgi:hypothetical protein